jgi:hypothetical protein
MGASTRSSGVGQAIVASPLVALGKKLEDTGFFERTTLRYR